MSHTARAAGLALAAALAATAGRASDPAGGWVSLFNGRDLTGWKVHPDTNKAAFSEVVEVKDGGRVTAVVGKGKKDGKDVTLWRVEDGLLVGGGPASHLFSAGQYENFHFRVEAKLNDGGNSGQYFRTEFGPGFPKGYEAQLNATHRDPIKTGSLYPNGAYGLDKFRGTLVAMKDTAPHKAGEFFTQEVVCEGPRIRILVNGKQTLDWTDPDHRFKKGHFALQGHDPGSVMTFRKVEVKEIK